MNGTCSICGRKGFMDSTGPGPHEFHGACINGALNFVSLIADSEGDSGTPAMARWLNAEKAGIAHPFRPFKKTVNTKPCPLCGSPIPDTGVWGLPTYTDVPENHKPDCSIRAIMEVNQVVNEEKP